MNLIISFSAPRDQRCSHSDQLPVGLLAQLVEHCTGIAEGWVRIPVQAFLAAAAALKCDYQIHSFQSAFQIDEKFLYYHHLINKLCVSKVLSFPFTYFIFLSKISIFFRKFCVTLVVSHVAFKLNFSADNWRAAAKSCTHLGIRNTFDRCVVAMLRSRPQSLRFFWSRGRRNGGLW